MPPIQPPQLALAQFYEDSHLTSLIPMAHITSGFWLRECYPARELRTCRGALPYQRKLTSLSPSEKNEMNSSDSPPCGTQSFAAVIWTSTMAIFSRIHRANPTRICGLGRLMFVCICTVALCSITATARAGGVLFGHSETLHEIQATKVPNWTLCYKTSEYFLIAGVYMKDDGYVLCEAGKKGTYTPLDTDRLREWQEAGLLPVMLPKYSIPIWSYLWGYSLWVIIAGIVLFEVIKKKLAENRKLSAQGNETHLSKDR